MGVYFNRKRTLRQYLSILKIKLLLFARYIPNRLTASRRKLPDFLIIGAMKGGTSSLFHYLNQHPDVELSREQEVHYFAKYYRRGEKYYRSFFPRKSANKLSGESSPYYLFHPLVPARVKKDLPKGKIIILLRDPVIRAFSHYQMQKGIDTAKNFADAIELETERVKSAEQGLIDSPHSINLSHQAYSYLSRGLYFEQLNRWLEHYSLGELIIIKSEDFFTDPTSTLKRVYSELGLEEIYPKDLRPINQREYDEIPVDDREKCRSFFKKDGEQLKELLGEHFSW